MAQTRGSRKVERGDINTQTNTHIPAGAVTQLAVKFFCGSPNKVEAVCQHTIALKLQLAEMEAEIKRHEAEAKSNESENNTDDTPISQTDISIPSSGQSHSEDGISHEKPPSALGGETYETGFRYDVPSQAC